jgi:hypothetical protein
METRLPDPPFTSLLLVKQACASAFDKAHDFGKTDIPIESKHSMKMIGHEHPRPPIALQGFLEIPEEQYKMSCPREVSEDRAPVGAHRSNEVFVVRC